MRRRDRPIHHRPRTRTQLPDEVPARHSVIRRTPHHRTPPPDDDPVDVDGADGDREATLGVSSASMSDRRKCIRPDGYLTTGIKPSRAQRHS